MVASDEATIFVRYGLTMTVCFLVLSSTVVDDEEDCCLVVGVSIISPVAT